MEFDFNTLVELKKILENKIDNYNDRIENFSIKGSDEEYNELLNNAKYFRDMIQKINKELKKL